MKGFIEVTSREFGARYIVNVHSITNVREDVIHFADDRIWCNESYDEIVEKIKEALEL